MTTTLDHIDALRDVFTEVTQDCLLLDLAPAHVDVSRYSSAGMHVGIQFTGEDVAAVDALAESYQCQEGPGTAKGNYTRTGRLDINGRRVTVVVYTGRPKLPAAPAGYAPQAVEA